MIVNDMAVSCLFFLNLLGTVACMFIKSDTLHSDFALLVVFLYCKNLFIIKLPQNCSKSVQVACQFPTRGLTSSVTTSSHQGGFLRCALCDNLQHLSDL